MGQVCTREENVANDPGDQNAAPGYQPLKAAVNPHEPSHPQQIQPQPQAAQPQPAPQAMANPSNIEASHFEDLHLNAGSLEPTGRMNAISTTAQRKLDTLPVLTADSRPEYRGKYSMSSQGGSIMKEKQTQATYQGQMYRGVPHGFGRLVGVDGTLTEGFFEEGKPHGFVRHIMTNGQVFEGEFRDNNANGRGRRIDPNGMVTECDTWINGQPEGRVVQRLGNQVVFEGIQKGGKKTGDCKWYDVQTKTHHHGTFVNDRLDGAGKTMADNGEVHEGTFKNGVLEGKGTKTFVDGRIFTGDFVNGRPHGSGNLTSDSGKTVQQTWKEGKRV